MNDQIEALARTKAFSELNLEEQESVLADMPQQDYDSLHQLLARARELDSQAAAPPALRSKLMASMASRSKPRLWHRLRTTNLPLWQAAALLLLGLALGTCFKKEVVVEKIVTQWSVRVDTLWQDRIQWQERVVFKERVIYKEKAPAVPMAVQEQPAPPEVTAPTRLTSILPENHVGTSLGDAPELMLFFTQVK